MKPAVRIVVWGAAFLLAGCVQEREPFGPESAAELLDVQAALDCKVSVLAGSLECSPHVSEL